MIDQDEREPQHDESGSPSEMPHGEAERHHRRGDDHQDDPENAADTNHVEIEIAQQLSHPCVERESRGQKHDEIGDDHARDLDSHRAGDAGGATGVAHAT
ncbi:MAG: hypothetical protein M3Q38_02880 [Chloroflexota bacterium]|nr:hypothetical protein [Chloroflexota bacterium]